MRLSAIRRRLVAGVLILVPLWLTFVVLGWAFTALAAISEPVLRSAFDNLSEATGVNLRWLLPVAAVLLTLMVIYLVGWIGSKVGGARIHAMIDRLMSRLPFVNTVYGGARKLLSMLEAEPGSAQRVVLVDSPRSSGSSVGFVTRVLVDASTGKEFAAVYIPTTPNPTSGNLELVPIEDVRPSDITVDEAMSFVLSGGAVAPRRFDPQPDGPQTDG